MKHKDLIIISHAHRKANFRGPTDVIIDNLIDLKESFFLVEHDLCGEGDTFVFRFSSTGEQRCVETIGRSSKNKFARYFQEYTLNQSLVKKYVNKDAVAIFVNPLNALAGVAIKRRGLCGTSVFISADYTKNRFGNFILDKIYCLIDKYVSVHADITGSVSTRIQSLRRDFGLPSERNLFFPNTPPMALLESLKNNVKRPQSLVSVGSLSDQLSYYTMFEAVKILKEKYPGITLRLIGGGDREIEYKEYVAKNELGDNILFLGWMAHADALREVSKSQIGLALYSGAWNFNYYGDSMKIREYVGVGLPVITTDTHSTVDDVRVYQCGFVIDDRVNALVEKVEYLLDTENYLECSNNALKMSERYAGVYREFFIKIVSV